jgi:hypothetical protein
MGGLLERVSVPEGRVGPWSVARFEVSEADARFGNLRAAIGGRGRGGIAPGTYTQLRHDRRGLVMSDTPDEMRDHYPAVFHANGHVLLNGLGIGMVLGGVLKVERVTRVTVVEIDPDVAALVGPHYLADKRVEIIVVDAFGFKPPKGVRYGAVWHDIWDDLCADNLPEMTRLKRKYGRRADWQGCWGESWIRRWSQ